VAAWCRPGLVRKIEVAPARFKAGVPPHPARVWGVLRIGDFIPVVLGFSDMNAHPLSRKSAPAPVVVSHTPVRQADVELTPKAEAKVANRLPRSEQLNKFEKDLEAHDPGNQPA